MFIKIKKYDIQKDIKRGVTGKSMIRPHFQSHLIINTDSIKFIEKISSDFTYDYDLSDVIGEELYTVYLGGGNGVVGFIHVDIEDANRIFEIIGVSL